MIVLPRFIPILPRRESLDTGHFMSDLSKSLIPNRAPCDDDDCALVHKWLRRCQTNATIDGQSSCRRRYRFTTPDMYANSGTTGAFLMEGAIITVVPFQYVRVLDPREVNTTFETRRAGVTEALNSNRRVVL